MIKKIVKWENDAAIKLTKEELRSIGLEIGSQVELRVHNEQPIIESIKEENKIDLEKLFDEYEASGDNYDPTDFDWGIGEPVGREML